MNYYIPDAKEKENSTQTCLHSNSPCSCCMVPKSKLLEIEFQHSSRSVNKAYKQFRAIEINKDERTREAMI